MKPLAVVRLCPPVVRHRLALLQDVADAGLPLLPPDGSLQQDPVPFIQRCRGSGRSGQHAGHNPGLYRPTLIPSARTSPLHCFSVASPQDRSRAAILKVAELVGGIGLGTGFRSANRSVAGRASPALWGWGSALAGDPGSWCRRAALRPAGAGAAGLVGGRAVMQGWARGTGPAAVPRAASPATRSSAGNRRTWSGSARPGRNRAA